MPKGHITRHFTWSEAACNHCGKFPSDQGIIVATAQWLEDVRTILGGPISPNSWYRCSFWNRRVGGAENSQHVRGTAVDFTCPHLTPAQAQTILRSYWGPGKLIRGLGQYGRFTHIDRRSGPAARWRG